MGRSPQTRGDSGQGLANHPGLGWAERYLGGSPDAEAAFINQAMADIHLVQRRNKAKGGAKSEARAFHAKIHAGIENAEFAVFDDIPFELQGGLFVPGKRYPTSVRLSSASGIIQPDTRGDLRGLAARVHSDEGPQDFLGTNGAASHARDARQFIEFAKAMSGSPALILPRLFYNIGVGETVRMFRTVIGQTKRKIVSLADESYFSRSAFAFGDFAVKFQFTPNFSANKVLPLSDGYLRDDLVLRLSLAPVVFDFQVQYFLTEKMTPIEDGSVIWPSPLFTIAQLIIPQQDLASVEALAAHAAVEELEYSPWNTTKFIRPLGSLNRARRFVYPASVNLRKNRRSRR